MPRPTGYEHSDSTRQKIAEAQTIHGHTKAPNGSPEKRTFQSWAAMRRRCLNPEDNAFGNYGGRGITICERWSQYLYFVEDMGLQPEKMSLDRIDNSGSYEKSNCRWATKQTQARNRRSNHMITIGGVTKTLAEWSDETGLGSSTIRARIKYNGGVVDNSILRPVN